MPVLWSQCSHEYFTHVFMWQHFGSAKRLSTSYYFIHLPLARQEQIRATSGLETVFEASLPVLSHRGNIQPAQDDRDGTQILILWSLNIPE